MTEPTSRPRPFIDDLVAACNSLGSSDINDGFYMKDSDCKACLREIIRILQTDTDQHQARILLGKLNILGRDLIPLIVQYCDFNDGDQDLFQLILKIATNVTSSVVMLFQEPPTKPEAIKIYNQLLEGLYNYKQSFANEPKIWHALNTYLRNIDDDETLFERVLILIRNILHIPVDVSGDLGVKGGSHPHELCLNHMDKSGMLSTFIQIASESKKGTEFCFHIIEIVYLILRDQNPVTVASATQSGTMKRKLDDNDQDKKKLLELIARDKMEREVRERNFRVPRFKTTSFEVKNLTSLGNLPIISRSLVTSRQDISFDNYKTQLRKSKNKKPLPEETNLAYHSDNNNVVTRVTASLKLFSKLFVEKVYANYMQQIKFNLMQKKAAENDETYYLWSINYFMPFSRQLYLDMDLISESLSTSSLHYIQILITDYKEKLHMEKKRSLYDSISQRLHQAVRAYKEILLTYQFIKPDTDSDHDLFSRIAITKKTIFSEIEYNTLILSLFKQYAPNKHHPGYVKDLIKTNHIYLELIEEYFKTTDDPRRMSYFMTSFCTPEILAIYTEVLRDFKKNDTTLNMNILKFFERVVHDCKSEVMLMQASLLRCLLEIHDYHSSLPGYHDFVRLTKHIMAAFCDMISKKRWMIQELLFWKTKNDVIEIEHAVDPPPPEPVVTADADGEASDEPVKPEESVEELMAELRSEVGSDGEDSDEVRNKSATKRGDSIEDLMAELGSDSDEVQPRSNRKVPLEPAEPVDGLLAQLNSDSSSSQEVFRSHLSKSVEKCVSKPLGGDSIEDLVAELDSQRADNEQQPEQPQPTGGDSVEDLIAELDSDHLDDDDDDDLSSLPSCSDDGDGI